MTEQEQLQFIVKVLDLTNRCDDHGSLWWRTDSEYAPFRFFINCNDVFWWGTGDCEDLTPDNIHIFEQAVKDVEEALNNERKWPSDAPLLFVSRVRGIRPQGAFYKYLDEETWPLFDAAGPVREVDFGNPHKHPLEEECQNSTQMKSDSMISQSSRSIWQKLRNWVSST